MSLQATVPTRAPSSQSWHVRRTRVMSCVCQSLFGNDTEPQVVGLVGESGSGKTTAAAEILREPEVLEFFSDGVVWLPVDEGAKSRIPSLMLELARMIREDIGIDGSITSPCISAVASSPGSNGGEGSDDSTAVVKDVLDRCSRHKGRPLRCLVVADNVWEREVVEKLHETGVWVLVTARNGDLVREAGGEAVRIDRLFEADAESVLRRASESSSGAVVGSPEAARNLMELCGCVAMDLAFVGRWSTDDRRANPRAWSDAADMIHAELRDPTLSRENTSDSTVADPRAPRPESSSRAGVRAGAAENSSAWSKISTDDPVRADTWSLSSGSDSSRDDNRTTRRKAVLRAGFRALVARNDADQTTLLYLALAVLPDGFEFSLDHAVVLLHDRKLKVWDEEAVLKAVETLERWTILTARGGKYVMHDAHSSFAREVLMGRPDVRRMAVQRWVGFVSSLDAVISIEKSTLSRLWAAVESVGGRGWRDILPYEQALVMLDNANPLCRACVEGVAKFRDLEGDLEGASLMWRRLLEIERGAKEPDMMYPLWELVRGAELMGRPAEVAAWRKIGYEMLTRAMAKEVSPGRGGDSMDDTIVRSLDVNMARFGPSDGVEAETMLRRALEIDLVRWGPKDTRVAATLLQLGVCTRQNKRLKEAEALLRRSLEIQTARLAPDEVFVARTAFHLGVCLRQAGQLQEAEKFMNQALDIETDYQGPGDLYVARSLYELGLCARLAGRLEEAESILTRALEIRETKLGQHDLLVAHTLHELGVCVRQQVGREGDAEGFLQRAVELKGAALGPRDASLARTLFQLGVCVLQAGRVEEAEVLLTRVLEVEEGRLGTDDVSVARIVFHLGVCFRRAGRREDAETMLRRALGTLEARLGPSNKEVATVQEMLGFFEATE